MTSITVLSTVCIISVVFLFIDLALAIVAVVQPLLLVLPTLACPAWLCRLKLVRVFWFVLLVSGSQQLDPGDPLDSCSLR
jgi:hypothetical protein